MVDVSCTYVATAPTKDSMSGQIMLKSCDPAIANTETLSSWDVIGIVAVIVVAGLVGQYVLHHLNLKKLAALKEVWVNDPGAQPVAAGDGFSPNGYPTPAAAQAAYVSKTEGDLVKAPPGGLHYER